MNVSSGARAVAICKWLKFEHLDHTLLLAKDRAVATALVRNEEGICSRGLEALVGSEAKSMVP